MKLYLFIFLQTWWTYSRILHTVEFGSYGGITSGLIWGPIFNITITDADIGNLKSLHTFFDTYLNHMLVKYEHNCMVRTIQNVELIDKNG